MSLLQRNHSANAGAAIRLCSSIIRFVSVAPDMIIDESAGRYEEVVEVMPIPPAIHGSLHPNQDYLLKILVCLAPVPG